MTIPLFLNADNIGDPSLAWDDATAAFQLRRAEAARDLGLLSDTEMAKAEQRLKHFGTVTITNPFTGEVRRIAKNW